MSSFNFKSATFAAFAATDPKVAEAAWVFLVDFAEETLARDSALELAVEGRFDPAGRPDDETGQDTDWYRRTIILSVATFERYNDAVNTLLRAIRERTGSSAGLTLEDALSLEGYTVGQVRGATRALINRWAELSPTPLPKRSSGIFLALGIIALLGAGIAYARS